MGTRPECQHKADWHLSEAQCTTDQAAFPVSCLTLHLEGCKMMERCSCNGQCKTTAVKWVHLKVSQQL